MKQENPLVSIGMPTYPGGLPTLKRAIDSVLGQTYRNIELVITENPTKDGIHAAQALCEEYARQDNCVKYLPHKKDVGVEANYAAAFNNTQGEYFCWVTSANFLDKYFIEKCLARLRDDKEAVMAMSHTVHTNEEGEITHRLDPKDFVVSERDLYSRLKQFILMPWAGGKAMSFHGLWRRTALGTDPGKEFNERLYADINFIFRRLALGPFLFVPEVLFFKVIRRGRESREHEKLNFPRVFSALFGKSGRFTNAIPIQLANTFFLLSIKTLPLLSRAKLLWFNCVAASRILTRRRY